MSDYDSEIEEIKKEDEWREHNRIKDMFLKACEIGDIDYVKANIEEQDVYKGRGLTLACKNKNIQVIKFLIDKGAFGCRNCSFKKVGFSTPWSIFCQKEKERISKETPYMSFGDMALLFKKNWKNINKTDLNKYEKEAILINQGYLKCLKKK